MRRPGRWRFYFVLLALSSQRQLDPPQAASGLTMSSHVAIHTGVARALSANGHLEWCLGSLLLAICSWLSALGSSRLAWVVSPAIAPSPRFGRETPRPLKPIAADVGRLLALCLGQPRFALTEDRPALSMRTRSTLFQDGCAPVLTAFVSPISDPHPS